ncbi:MAG: hypothetical protein J6Q67_07295, partial [Clostridia bacterium]|nr:hypothetical protein [Clostridia bacterium]
MRDDITSIPISEIFEKNDGCPVCRLRDMLEERSVKYITGAAMMEPDVRIETNKTGFCRLHYGQMLKIGKKLNVALMLQSHLAEISKIGLTKVNVKTKTGAESCFICNKINRNMEQLMLNICRLWEREKEFRNIYSEQPFVCLEHCQRLTEAANKMPKKLRKEFVEKTIELTHKQLEELA